MLIFAAMTDDIAFDPTLDVRLDSGNVDPDRKSKQLRRAHLRLWGTPLPSEAPFELYDPGPRGYLCLTVGIWRVRNDE